MATGGFDILGIPCVSFGRDSTPSTLTISGVTRTCDGSGTLPGCTVFCFRTSDNAILASTTSDGSGNYSVTVPVATACYLVATNTGPPFVAGTTRNDVVGT